MLFRSAFAHITSDWVTTQWQKPVEPGFYTLRDLNKSVTDWGEVFAKSTAVGVKDAVVSKIQGGSSSAAFKQGGALGFLSELYGAYVPSGPGWDNGPGWLGNGDGGGPKEPPFAPKDTIVRWGQNNFGKFQSSGQVRGMAEEGSWFSRFMDGSVPGMRKTSYIHDAWAVQGTFCESACISGMVPSAAAAYGDLFERSRHMFSGLTPRIK